MAKTRNAFNGIFITGIKFPVIGIIGAEFNHTERHTGSGIEHPTRTGSPQKGIDIIDRLFVGGGWIAT